MWLILWSLNGMCKTRDTYTTTQLGSIQYTLHSDALKNKKTNIISWIVFHSTWYMYIHCTQTHSKHIHTTAYTWKKSNLTWNFNEWTWTMFKRCVYCILYTSVAIMNEKYYYYSEFDEFYCLPLHYLCMNDKSELLATLVVALFFSLWQLYWFLWN